MDPLLLPLLFIAVLALPLILGSRRQKRAMAEAQRLQNSLTVGDRVMTTSGLHATVVDTSDENDVGLEIAPGVRTTWLRAAVREKINPDDAVTSDAATDDDEIESAQPEAKIATPVEEGARSDKA
jgi:preprotein translocase subunit YajC